MVIVCPECTTKFRVNPERIPVAGAKVRCARCKHVFMVNKPAAEPILDTRELAEPPEDKTIEPAPQASETTSAEDFSFGTEETAAEVAEETAAEGFDYEKFREVKEEAVAEESFTFSGDEAEKDEQFTLAEEQQTSEPLTDDKPEETFPEVAEQVTEDIQSNDDEIAEVFTPADEVEAIDEPTAAAQPQSSPQTSVMRILLLLVLGLLILGGVLIYMNGPEQVQQTLQQLLGQQGDRSLQTGQISLNNLQGSFINNQETGELFVIRGEAINQFNEPRASIQVKGVIFDANGKPLLQKTIFAGNPISDQELRSLPFNKLEELMGNQFGQSLSNMNVNTEQAIPFTIVFRDLPKNLSEFSVNVTSSQPATE